MITPTGGLSKLTYTDDQGSVSVFGRARPMSDARDRGVETSDWAGDRYWFTADGMVEDRLMWMLKPGVCVEVDGDEYSVVGYPQVYSRVTLPFTRIAVERL